MNTGTFRTLRRTYGKYRWHLVALAALGFVSAIFEGIGINIAIPLLSFFMGGGAAPTDFISQTVQRLFETLHIPFSFRYLLGFVLALFILRAFTVGIFGFIRSYISADFLSDMSEDMLRQTLHASWPFLLKQKIGAMHNTLVRDIQRSASLLEVMSQVLQSFTGFLMYLLVAINISAVMTLSALVGGALLMFVIRPLLRRTRVMAGTMAATEKEFSQYLSEHIYGMKAVKAAGVEARAIENGGRLVRAMRTLMIRIAVVRSASGSFFQPASLIFVIILFIITYRQPGFSIVAFAAALYLIQKIFTYLESGQSALQAVSELIPYARHVSDFKEMLIANREASTAGTASFIFTNTLAFEGVSFSYGEDVTTLRDISFTVARGQTIGIIGPSGAGKTSLADLLLRLFRPISGKILLDGASIDTIAIDGWRQHVGYVAQDVFLINDTVEENIRFYRSELTEEEIIKAAKQANIYDFISGLKDGFKTVVGDRGVLLSGGQRQRIALARALAGSPKILVLDEATSALDTASEKIIQDALASLRGSITVFIIAHRLSTIDSADMILVLENGRLVEQGTPEELRKNPESYFSMHRGIPVSEK